MKHQDQLGSRGARVRSDGPLTEEGCRDSHGGQAAAEPGTGAISQAAGAPPVADSTSGREWRWT